MSRRRAEDFHFFQHGERPRNRQDLSARLTAAANQSEGIGSRRCQVPACDPGGRAGAPNVERSTSNQRQQIATLFIEKQDEIGILRAAKQRVDAHSLPRSRHGRSGNAIFFVTVG